MERDITAVKDTVLDDADSEINSSVKIVWNQVYLDIRRAGGNDFRQHIEGIMRRSLVTGCAVCYLSLPLTDPHTPAIVSALQQYGFFYAGIMPYEKAGQDAIRMQCLLSGGISPEYVIAVSDWGKELKEYVLSKKENTDHTDDTGTAGKKLYSAVAWAIRQPDGQPSLPDGPCMVFRVRSRRFSGTFHGLHRFQPAVAFPGAFHRPACGAVEQEAHHGVL